MRRVVSQAPSMPKTTWFSCTPSCISSAPAAMRASSCSARAGMIASRSGERARERRLLDREPVGVGRRHDELARARTGRGCRSARAGSRRATRERPTRADRLQQRLAVDLVQLRPRRRRAAAGSPRTSTCAGGSSPSRPSISSTDSSLCCSIETSDVRQRAHDVEQQPARARRPRPRRRRPPRATCAARAPCRSRRARAARPRRCSRIPPSTSTAVRVETRACDQRELLGKHVLGDA